MHAALNPSSTMGSVISEEHLGRMENTVQAHASDGTLLAGGARMTGKSELDGFDFSRGAFFPPTVIADISTDSPLWTEEIFGPVVVVKRFSVSPASRWVRQH
jgi:acyl-CoA reductase-like NAD-dependent aldehyde dehydrogenase